MNSLQGLHPVHNFQAVPQVAQRAGGRPRLARAAAAAAADDPGEPLDSSASAAPGPPPLYGGFVRRPVASFSRAAPCRRCGGTGAVACAQCSGTGRLARGGYQKRNPVNAARVVGSKWTAMERTFGWRHFRVMQKRGSGREAFVLLAATCDESTQLWVNLQNLKDRQRWASGWLQKDEMRALEAERASAADGGGGGAAAEARSGAACKGCTGTGRVPCPLCSRAGQVVEL